MGVEPVTQHPADILINLASQCGVDINEEYEDTIRGFCDEEVTDFDDVEFYSTSGL